MGTEDGDHPRPRPFGDGWDDIPDSAQSGLGMGSIPVPSWAPWAWEYYGGTRTSSERPRFPSQPTGDGDGGHPRFPQLGDGTPVPVPVPVPGQLEIGTRPIRGWPGARDGDGNAGSHRL